MTLSIGNKVLKVQDDGVTPVPNEVHVLFEVVGVATMSEKNEVGEWITTQLTKMKVIR